MIRVLLYGDVDLNLIDGSAVWLASLAEVLGGIKGVSVTVLQKTRIERDTVIREAARVSRVEFVDPWQRSTTDAEVRGILKQCPPSGLSPAIAAALINLFDTRSVFDVVFVRGMETLELLLKRTNLTRRLWAYVTNPAQYATGSACAQLREIRRRCGKVICQTDEARAMFLELTGPGRSEHFLLIPPMIAAPSTSASRSLDPLSPRLGYSGKFSPPYRILEMLDAFDLIRARAPGAEFHLVGDKFHNSPPVSNFTQRVEERLKMTPGVIWHGGVSRTEANRILSKVHIAASWRTPEFDTSLELSTKVLEYSALGLPVLMNPSPVQRRVFGTDYGAYVSIQQEFVDRFFALVDSPELYQTLSNHVRRIAHHHTFASHRQRLQPVLRGPALPIAFESPRPSLLWSSHDFKFLNPIKDMLEATGRYRSMSDLHEGHVIRNVARSRELLNQADLIFCEWCLGNAEWYSHHKRPDQRLVIRLHRQEIELPFLNRIQWSNVDRIIFISDWLKDEFLSRFPEMKDRALLIYNAIDWHALSLDKLPGAEFNLGLLGCCPMLKAPHLAVDVLTALKQVDRRYTLFLKGKAPQQLAWLWRRPKEQAYYHRLSERIDASPYANSIVFEPHGDDVSTWFSKIGFILSTSEHEGSHQAVPEGMASGAIPVIRDWRGAERLYSDRYIFSTVSEAVELVRRWNSPQHYQAEASNARMAARSFDLRIIGQRYVDLVGDLLQHRRPSGTVEATTKDGRLPRVVSS